MLDDVGQQLGLAIGSGGVGRHLGQPHEAGGRGAGRFARGGEEPYGLAPSGVNG